MKRIKPPSYVNDSTVFFEDNQNGSQNQMKPYGIRRLAHEEIIYDESRKPSLVQIIPVKHSQVAKSKEAQVSRSHDKPTSRGEETTIIPKFKYDNHKKPVEKSKSAVKKSSSKKNSQVTNKTAKNSGSTSSLSRSNSTASVSSSKSGKESGKNQKTPKKAREKPSSSNPKKELPKLKLDKPKSGSKSQTPSTPKTSNRSHSKKSSKQKGNKEISSKQLTTDHMKTLGPSLPMLLLPDDKAHPVPPRPENKFVYRPDFSKSLLTIPENKTLNLTGGNSSTSDRRFLPHLSSWPITTSNDISRNIMESFYHIQNPFCFGLQHLKPPPLFQLGDKEAVFRHCQNLRNCFPVQNSMTAGCEIDDFANIIGKSHKAGHKKKNNKKTVNNTKKKSTKVKKK